MRTAVIAATIAMLTTACSTSQTENPPAPNPPPASSTPSSNNDAAEVLTWGGSGTSSGVYIELGTPKASADPVIGADGKPDTAQRYVLVPVTAGNKTTVKAKLSFSGRAGQQEAPPVATAGDPMGEFLPGEGGPFEQRFRVPVAATQLVIEVYANVGDQPAAGRLTFRGPLPPR